ncbi:LysR family transcriptional regulator [Kutzneria sp. CA-103260]|uniref:LysR family transcriptional regulator n=1 Tax=Kutzneria sp. CA-103260 TaxID=2802641 RepID=UPI001BA52B7A|nr:LysR family transcriptional regulator [Kutzneria sp. CA-103260]QUQ66197.1 HTH-type transcriptional regulator HdfR [Kutzneria sp. CA-103260]
MDIRQIEFFVVVAEELNFTRAAELTPVTQSGLSLSIRSLERELGAALETVRLGAEQCLGAAIALPDVLAAFQRRRPAVTLRFEQVGGRTLLDAGLLAQAGDAPPQVALHHVQVGTAHAAAGDAHQQLPGAGLGGSRFPSRPTGSGSAGRECPM